MIGVRRGTTWEQFTGSVARVGRSVGSLYAANTIGSIVGSMIPVFVLIPTLGIQQSMLIYQNSALQV